MKHNKELIEMFRKNWVDEKDLIVMPHTAKGKLYLQQILKDISVGCILDNDKSLDDTKYQGVPIFEARRYLQENKKGKILISSYYQEIAEQLEQYGYQENVDFMDMHQFVSLWYWEKKRQIHLLDVHIAITTFCSLNCRNCNMFMNHYEKSKRNKMGLIEFQQNVKSLFNAADYCYQFTILGGEPLLHSELSEMIRWLSEHYASHIGRIEIVTNGTIVPTTELLQVCKKHRVGFTISDYGKEVSSMQRIDEIKGCLLEWDIEYKHNPDLVWKDFYFPREKQKVMFDTVREHMLICNPIFRGLNDQHFYYCHIVWSAVKAGLLEEKETDYIDLSKDFNENDKMKLLLYDLGIMENKYVSLCEFCGGCGSDNTSVIPAGIQEYLKV